MAARVEPTTEPMPPRMLTPPTTEAVMMVSSRLGGTVDWMTQSWVANRTDGDAGEGAVDQEDLHDRPAPARDAGEPCGLRIAADGVDGAAEPAVAHPEGGRRP